MERFRRGVDWMLAHALVVLVALAVLNVLWQVFTRWVLKSPSSYTEELARYLLIWIGLLGASYAAGQKLHLAIDLLPTKLKGRSRHLLEIVIQLFLFAFALFVMIVGGGRLVELTLRTGQTSAALGLPLGYVYFVLPLSGALIVFYATVSIIERVRAIRGEAVPLVQPDRTSIVPVDGEDEA